MKIKCNVCETEYSVDRVPTSPVKCAVCGHTWTVTAPTRRGAWMMFIASLCALLSAAVFATAVIVKSKMEQAHRQPVVAQITEIKAVNDDNGVPRFAVKGIITNQSMEIYGVPDVIIVSRDDAGHEIARQKFMPPATLIEAGASVGFYNVLGTATDGVKKITVELEIGDK